MSLHRSRALDAAVVALLLPGPLLRLPRLLPGPGGARLERGSSRKARVASRAPRWKSDTVL